MTIARKTIFQALLASVVATLLMSAALAIEVTPGDQLVLTTPDGSVTVGVGVAVDGYVEVGLVEGFDGFATLTIRHVDGGTVAFDVVIDGEGSIEFVAGPDAGSTLAEVLAAGDVDLRVSSEDEADLASAEDALNRAWANADEDGHAGLCQAAAAVGVELSVEGEPVECTPASESAQEEGDDATSGAPEETPTGRDDAPVDDRAED